MKHNLLTTSLLCLALGSASVHAANKYWDINGTVAGAGGATPFGNISGTTFWNPLADGTGTTAVWSGTTDTAVFSAGGDATGEFNVTLNSGITAAGILVEEGTVDLVTPSAITIGTGAITISSGAILSLDTSARIAATAGATCTLNGGTLRNSNPATAGALISSNVKIVLGASGGTVNYSTAGLLSIYDGVIAGTAGGSLIKEGAGILALTGTCTYNGSTIINNGTLRIRTTSNRLPGATDVTINSPGAFDPGSTLGMITTVKSVNGTGNITYSASSWLVITGNVNSAISGIISDGASSGRIYKGGTGTMNLGGVNTFDGRIVITNGTVIASPGSSLMGPIGDVYIGNGSTLTLNNDTQAIENLVDVATPGGTVNLNGNGSGHTLTLGLGFSSPFSGVIAGVGALVVNGGAFTLTLSGNNSYNGLTTLGSGTLIMTGHNTGNGGYTVNGGTLKLTGSNTGTGTTTLNGGKLLTVTGGSLANSPALVSTATYSVQVATANGTFPCGPMTFFGGSTLDFNFGYVVPSTTVAPIPVSGAVDFSAGQPTVTALAYNLPSGPGDYPLVSWTAPHTGTFTETAVSLGPLTIATVRVNGTDTGLELHVTQNKEPLYWTGPLPTGSGTWDTATPNWVDSSSGAATYAEVGGVGDQVVFEDTKSGTPSPITVSLSSTFSPANVTIDNSTKEYFLSGGGVGISGGTLLTKKGSNRLTLTSTAHGYTGGTLIQNGTLALGDGVSDGMVPGNIDITTGASLVVSNLGSPTMSSIISGGGSLSKGSAGTLTLSGANSLTGGQTIYDGILMLPSTANVMNGPVLVSGPSAKVELTSSGCIGATVAGSGAITLDNGAIFQNDDATAFANPFLTGNRSIKIRAGGGAFNVPSGAILGYTGTILGDPAAGTGTLTYNGPGELRCYGTGAQNSFGKLVINGGMFTGGHAVAEVYNTTYGAVPATTTADAIMILNGAQLRLAGGLPVTLDAKQGITIGTGGGVIRAIPGQAGAGILTIPGKITGGGALQLNSASDSGVIALGGPNDCTGGMALIKGTLNINSATALGASGTFSINPWLTNSVTIDNTSGGITLTPNNPQSWWANFTFTGTGDLDLGAGAVTLNASLTVTAGARNLTVGGGITEASGGLSLTKAGAGGTLILKGANNYSGGTTVNAGTLDIRADGGLGSGSVVVANGATLRLTGGSANTYINSAATLTLNGVTPTVKLDFTGTPNTINALYFGASQMPAGTWGAIGSGADHQSAFFTGTGKLNVGTGSAVLATQISTILSIADMGGGNFQFTLQGTPAAAYYLVSSGDVMAAMVTWATVTGSATNAPHPSGQWKFTVNNAAPQYYRLKAVNPGP